MAACFLNNASTLFITNALLLRQDPTGLDHKNTSATHIYAATYYKPAWSLQTEQAAIICLVMFFSKKYCFRYRHNLGENPKL